MENQSLHDALKNCSIYCNNCLSSCLKGYNYQNIESCIKICIDCISICNVSSDFLARNSLYSRHIMRECVEICTACAEECELHSNTDDSCNECAVACRECIEECKMFMNQLLIA